LELVSQLSHRGLDFRFKGGNSLLVLLEDPHRFSIDVDIVTTATKDELAELVERIATGCPLFTRWEKRAPRTKPWLPMISFKLFFESHYQSAEESYVMLDCVLRPPPYDGVRRRVRCGDIYEAGHQVEVPSVSGLIGDKLLTIGPSTLGIPLGKGKEAHRLKHVFDVSLLSRQGYDLEAVRRSLVGCMEQENDIQGSTWGQPEVLEDTLRFCHAPLEHETPPDPDSLDPDTYLYEIAKGFEGFRQHIYRLDYTWDTLRDDFRRVTDLVGSLAE
ncbi:MAG: nucleotidyl transferase AbiEii/AbiGii toxin family protein, partial [Polyangiales bacterium]